MPRLITPVQASVLLRDMYCKITSRSWEGIKVTVEESEGSKILVVYYKGTLTSIPRSEFRGYKVAWKELNE